MVKKPTEKQLKKELIFKKLVLDDGLRLSTVSPVLDDLHFVISKRDLIDAINNRWHANAFVKEKNLPEHVKNNRNFVTCHDGRFGFDRWSAQAFLAWGVSWAVNHNSGVVIKSIKKLEQPHHKWRGIKEDYLLFEFWDDSCPNVD